MTSTNSRHTKKRTSPLAPYRKHAIVALLTVAVAGAVFAAGYFLGHRSAPATAESSAPLCEVSYVVGDTLLESETLEAGTKPANIGYPELKNERVLLWLDGNGREAEPAELVVYTDIRYTAVTGPRLCAEGGFLPCENGLFRPESPLTRLEAAQALYTLMVKKPDGKAELKDVDKKDDAYIAAAALTAAGLMEAPDGVFDPDGSYTEEDFAALAGQFFRPGELNAAMGLIRGIGSETVTRAEAAVVFSALLGLSDTDTLYFPDVPADYWAAEAVSLAGQEGDWGKNNRADAGFMNIDGYLYHADEEGFFLRNGYIGSLYFDSNGRFTSGSESLDRAVAAAIRENTTDKMEREEMLRAMYNYVRDGFVYLRRNYYDTGETGWALDEAVTMYESGAGNCYSYAAAFWAAARGLGYDAMTVSGTIGSERSPHGWVEIPIDDVRYIFDVEIEMAYIRDSRKEIDMFKMEQLSARYGWLYVELTSANRVAPRDRSGIFALR